MKRYRILKFGLDTTRNILRTSDGGPAIKETKKQIGEYLKSRFGEEDFDNKFKRYMSVKKPSICIVEEYWYLLNEIVNAYVAGQFYPALTGACCLRERIFNILILKLRPYYKSSKIYKYIHNQGSFNNWELAIDILEDWKVIEGRTKETFRSLGKIRQKSIHYWPKKQDLRKITINAIKDINFIADRIFGILNRKDILLLFNVPGEIYIKKEAEKIPLVKEFYVPSAFSVGYKYTITNAGRVKDEKYENKKISDEEFVDIRKSFLNK